MNDEQQDKQQNLLENDRFGSEANDADEILRTIQHRWTMSKGVWGRGVSYQIKP